MVEVKKIVQNSIKTVIVEMFYGVIISIIATCKNMLDTIIMQYGSNSEIARIKREIPLFWVKVITDHNNSLHLISNGLILIMVILMIYAMYKYIVNTFLVKNSPSEEK